MPELPEVETIRKIISRQVCGEMITNVTVLNNNTVDKIEVSKFVEGVKGSIISSIERAGKNFLFNLSSGTMVIHLRMEGKLTVVDTGMNCKYTLITFDLSNGKTLTFSDRRKFAKAYFIPRGDIDTVSGVDKLGIEPFATRLTDYYLKTQWKHKYYTIKEALMDQSVVCGFGNVYSDELMFVSGIYPKRSCNNLTDYEYNRLASNIPKIINAAIRLDDMSVEEYNNMTTDSFKASKHAYVYGRSGLPCKVCGTKIESFKLAGRTCSYCPKCQKNERGMNLLGDFELTPEMFGIAAQYIGTIVKQDGKFELEGINPSSCTWREYMYKVYDYMLCNFIVDRMPADNFYAGMQWVHKQDWKDE